MRLDYHLHPDYSLDAQGTVEEYCLRALELGLEAICITTHHDSNPKIPEMCLVRVQGEEISVWDYSWLEEYTAEILAARRDFGKRGLFVGLGLEIDFFSQGMEDFLNLRDSFPFDYLLGSVHALDSVHLHTSKSKAFLSETKPEELCREYYHLVQTAVESGIFDAIGHIDGYRKYGEDCYGGALHSVHLQYARPVLELMAKKGVALEINTAAAFNNASGKNIVYGGGDLLSLARRLGLELVTFGSDSHQPQELGYQSDKARRILLEAGFDRVYAFRQHKPFPKLL